jgi:hypothetical protein
MIAGFAGQKTPGSLSEDPLLFLVPSVEKL